MPTIGDVCDPNACEEGGNLSCQLTDEVAWVYADARVANAEKGDLILCPASSSGIIGSQLGALTPPQHFTHMGIFVADGTIRQCTFLQDRLQDEAYMHDHLDVTLTFHGAGYPVDVYTATQAAPVHGFTPAHVRFGWPGTVSLPVDDAIYGDLYGDTYPRCRFLDAEHPDLKMYAVHELSFSPVAIDPPPGRAAPFVLPPLLVKPCTNRSEGPFIRQVAWDVADTAAGMDGHYRFYGYSDAAIALDPARQGPLRPHPLQGIADPSQLPVGPTLALVCSSFVWAAVQLTASARHYTLVLDPVPVDDEHEPCTPLLRPLYGEHAQTDASTKDGLYLYDTAERQLAANALWDHVKAAVRATVEASVPTAAATATLQSRAGVAASILNATPFDEVVANQLVNTFASDAAEDLGTTWQHTQEGRAVSPDDIFRFWDQTREVTPGSSLHGLYGQNEAAIVIYRRPEQRPVYRWAATGPKGTVHGRVRFQGNVILGITAKLNCNAAVTGLDGYLFTVPEGHYRITAGMFDPVSGFYVSGFTDVTVVRDTTIPATDIILDFPTEDRRQIVITGHADLVDRATLGSDDWAHPDIVLRPLQVGPAMDVIWDPERMVWPFSPLGLFPDGVNHPTPIPGKPTRLGDWDYIEARYSFGEDTLLLQIHTQLRAAMAIELSVLASIVDDGFYEISHSVVHTIAKDASYLLTIHLKSGETAPDSAQINLTIANNRSPA